jgi:hypothetical protein
MEQRMHHLQRLRPGQMALAGVLMVQRLHVSGFESEPPASSGAPTWVGVSALDSAPPEILVQEAEQAETLQ